MHTLRMSLPTGRTVPPDLVRSSACRLLAGRRRESYLAALASIWFGEATRPRRAPQRNPPGDLARRFASLPPTCHGPPQRDARGSARQAWHLRVPVWRLPRCLSANYLSPTHRAQLRLVGDLRRNAHGSCLSKASRSVPVDPTDLFRPTLLPLLAL